jgi:hyperosmotically inducible protein
MPGNLGAIVKRKLRAACFLIINLSVPMMLAQADVDIARGQPLTFVKDSPITAAIKEKFVAAQLPSLATIKVGTDEINVVWLSGTAGTQAEVNLAESIARRTVGVAAVNTNILVEDR